MTFTQAHDQARKVQLAIREAHKEADGMKPSREKSLVLTKLDEARLWLREYKDNLQDEITSGS